MVGDYFMIYQKYTSSELLWFLAMLKKYDSGVHIISSNTISNVA